jgi:hypothetical protein
LEKEKQTKTEKRYVIIAVSWLFDTTLFLSKIYIVQIAINGIKQKIIINLIKKTWQQKKQQ